MKRKMPQEIINYLKENDWCLNESKIKLAITMYNLGFDDASGGLDEHE